MRRAGTHYTQRISYLTRIPQSRCNVGTVLGAHTFIELFLPGRKPWYQVIPFTLRKVRYSNMASFHVKITFSNADGSVAAVDLLPVFHMHPSIPLFQYCYQVKKEQTNPGLTWINSSLFWEREQKDQNEPGISCCHQKARILFF